jgi:23S rRNA (cytosine1962-C5)-methyltransferase
LENKVVVFREYGVLFSAHLIKGHKTGYFLDHRDNRRKVGAYAQNKRVLDVFSYAGGFSVHALAGGANSVTSVDISKQALALAKENATLNGNFKNHDCMAGDAFEIMNRLVKEKKKFDLIVVDPPSFAKRSDEIPSAVNSYNRLISLALKLASKKAILVMASCTSRINSDEFFDIMESAVQKAKRASHTGITSYEILEKTFHDIDHPIGFPEGAYLKTIYFQLG